MKFSLILLTLLIFSSCNGQEVNQKGSTGSNVAKTGEFNLTDTTYFDLVTGYIKKNGTVRKVNASSIESKEMIIAYYFLSVDNMEISIDHSDRIYMSLNEIHYGNILKENSQVRPEIIYGTPDTNPQLTKEKENKVLEIYRKLIVLALHK